MIRNIFKCICAVVIIFICVFSNLRYIYADNEFEMQQYIPDNIKYTINGGIINLNASINDEGNYEIVSEIDTKNLEEGYYTAFIYENAKKDWSNFEGISFNFENLGKDYIDLNVDMISKNQDDFKIGKNKIVYVKSNSNNLVQQKELTNGVIKISEKFNGTIIIPFENLNSDGKTLNPAEVSLWGLGITIPNDNVRQFIISNFSLVNFNSDFKQYMNNNFIIHGDTEVIIPNEGEFTYLYKALKNPSESDFATSNLYNSRKNYYENASFSIYGDINGVSITKDGVLSVDNKAEEKSITIVVTIDENKFTQGLEVNLVRSNANGMITNDGVSIDVPKIENLSNKIKLNNVLMSNKYLNVFRSIIVTGFLSFFAAIVVWMRFNNAKNKK